MLLNYVFFHKPVGCRGFVSGTCPFGQVAANHQFASPLQCCGARAPALAAIPQPHYYRRRSRRIFRSHVPASDAAPSVEAGLSPAFKKALSINSEGETKP